MHSVDLIKQKLKEIFLEAIGFDPFKSDDYFKCIYFRFALDELDIIELILRIEKQFNIEISLAKHEDEKIMLMNIDQLVNFIASKLDV